MSNLTSVTLTAGVPTAGSGTVSTLDALMADGGQATLGAKTDAKNTATDTTAVSSVSIWKQISASAQAAASSLAGTLPVSNTLLTNMGVGEYETVAASQTDQVMGATGGTGDYLAAVLIVPATAAAGAVSIKDGSTSISIFAGGGTTALPTLAPIRVELGMISVSGAWKITTGTNVSAIGIGNFT